VSLPWAPGGRIPKRYTCDGADVAPAVRARPQPKAEAVVMTDPDAPGGTFVHWTKWGTTEGKNSFGRTGYSGPCPPNGDKPHHYVVTVYALRSQLRLPAGSDPKTVLKAVYERAVVSGSTKGVYSR
jgi:phosphatidylethanolamine-binding protein (PEBP) family uncharacterized protein